MSEDTMNHQNSKNDAEMALDIVSEIMRLRAIVRRLYVVSNPGYRAAVTAEFPDVMQRALQQ